MGELDINLDQIQAFQNFFLKTECPKKFIKISESQTNIYKKPIMVAEYFSVQEKKGIRTGRTTVKKEIHKLKHLFEILKVKKIKNICDLRSVSNVNNINEGELAKYINAKK